ncbi:hypothetical protein, partial [Klebsiella pneumoniae]|uniref:hypothetical protein n=1 Tax=Klebsiella pneumoniae TaxID=573 RepID=UPI00272EF56D
LIQPGDSLRARRPELQQPRPAAIALQSAQELGHGGAGGGDNGGASHLGAHRASPVKQVLGIGTGRRAPWQRLTRRQPGSPAWAG